MTHLQGAHQQDPGRVGGGPAVDHHDDGLKPGDVLGGLGGVSKMEDNSARWSEQLQCCLYDRTYLMLNL